MLNESPEPTQHLTTKVTPRLPVASDLFEKHGKSCPCAEAQLQHILLSIGVIVHMVVDEQAACQRSLSERSSDDVQLLSH